MANRKSIGIGSLSAVIFVITIVFSLSTRNRDAIGDWVLNSVGLKAWSNGTNGIHYTIIVTIVLLFISWFIGRKYPDNFGAALSKKLSLWIGVFLTAMALFNI